MKSGAAMPNGNVHGPVAVGVAVAVTVGAFYLDGLIGVHGSAVQDVIDTAVRLGAGAGSPLAHRFFFTASLGAWLGICVDPDRDHWKTTMSEQRVYRHSRLLGDLNVWFWQSYVRSHGHRGRGSHTWPRGTVGRFLYLLWFPILLSLILGAGVYGWPLGATGVAWIGVFVGISINDCFHLLLDLVWDKAGRLGIRRLFGRSTRVVRRQS